MLVNSERLLIGLKYDSRGRSPAPFATQPRVREDVRLWIHMRSRLSPGLGGRRAAGETFPGKVPPGTANGTATGKNPRFPARCRATVDEELAILAKTTADVDRRGKVAGERREPRARRERPRRLVRGPRGSEVGPRKLGPN